MDLTLIAVGVVSALIGLGSALVALRTFVPSVKRQIYGEMQAFPAILWEDLKTNPTKYEPILKEIRFAAEQVIIAEITGFLKLLHDNPEKFAPIVNGIAGDIGKMFPQMEKVGAMVNGVGEVGDQVIMQMIPRQYRGIYAIAKMFMGGGGQNGKNGSSDTKSPFG